MEVSRSIIGGKTSGYHNSASADFCLTIIDACDHNFLINYKQKNVSVFLHASWCGFNHMRWVCNPMVVGTILTFLIPLQRFLGVKDLQSTSQFKDKWLGQMDLMLFQIRPILEFAVLMFMHREIYRAHNTNTYKHSLAFITLCFGLINSTDFAFDAT